MAGKPPLNLQSPMDPVRILSYTIPEEWEGSTVSKFAKQYLGFSSRVLAGQKYEGGILVNGVPCHANAPLHAGDRIAFPLLGEKTEYPLAGIAEDKIGIIYEDLDYLIVAKPPGMPVHPSPGHDFDSLLSAVAARQEFGTCWRVRPLYRLDKDTSGAIPLAKHRVAAGAKLEKLYFAVCEGTLDGAGTVTAPVGLGEDSKIRRICGNGPGFQPAVTHWQSLAQGAGHTLLALRLETGRTHQIRVHMAHTGHPLAGDDLYGGALGIMSRQALHCARVHIDCKAVDMKRCFTAPIPEDMRQAFPWIIDAIINYMKEDTPCPLV